MNSLFFSIGSSTYIAAVFVSEFLVSAQLLQRDAWGDLSKCADEVLLSHQDLGLFILHGLVIRIA